MNLKKVKLPHTLILIYIMVVLTVIATWVVPGGEYQKVEKDGQARSGAQFLPFDRASSARDRRPVHFALKGFC